jgi:hypothetical protein
MTSICNRDDESDPENPEQRFCSCEGYQIDCAARREEDLAFKEINVRLVCFVRHMKKCQTNALDA